MKAIIIKGSKDHADVVAPPPLILGIVLAAGLLLHKLVPLFIVGHASALCKTMGNVLFLISGLMMVPTTVLMIRHKTALSHYKPTTALVTNGLFRYSRNPLYLALLMIYGGAALHANSLWMLFLAPVLFIILDRGVVVPEEHYLGRKCGDEYLEYKKKVRRWI